MTTDFSMKHRVGGRDARGSLRGERGIRTRRRGLIQRIQTPGGRFSILAAFLTVCVFTGGSSRVDAGLLLILRPATIVALAALLIASPDLRLGALRIPVVLLGLFAASMAIQLVPLPPILWLALPGHQHFAEAGLAAGVAQPWRPLSLTPDLTLNSLVALLPAVVMIIGFAGSEGYRRHLILFPLLLAAVSVVIGLIQITGGADSPAYLYRPTSDMLPVGLFANRNHQAVVLACALPALAIWACYPEVSRQRLAIAAGGLLLLLPVILVTGSRMGMLMAGVSSIAAVMLVGPRIKGRRVPSVVLVAGSVLILAVIGATVLAGRAISIDRLSELDGASVDLRWVTLPIVSKMAWDYFPSGTGYGAFDQVFRIYEPDFLLKPTFFNRAHNDILETILSGGAPALLLLILFVLWWIRQTIRAARLLQESPSTPFTILGMITSAILILASFVDYPLRTPLAGLLFILACCWLAGATDAGREAASHHDGSVR